jgi:hypothetical protein
MKVVLLVPAGARLKDVLANVGQLSTTTVEVAVGEYGVGESTAETIKRENLEPGTVMYRIVKGGVVTASPVRSQGEDPLSSLPPQSVG